MDLRANYLKCLQAVINELRRTHVSHHAHTRKRGCVRNISCARAPAHPFCGVRGVPHFSRTHAERKRERRGRDDDDSYSFRGSTQPSYTSSRPAAFRKLARRISKLDHLKFKMRHLNFGSFEYLGTVVNSQAKISHL